MSDTPINNNDQPAGTDQSVRIPVNQAGAAQGERAPDVEALVREYEQRYGGFRDQEAPEVQKTTRTGGFNFNFTPKMKNVSAPRNVVTTDNERMWAAIAHVSVLLTLFVGVPTAGISTIITLFIPLMIYFYYREKSEYVAFHALQAFTLQVLGTIGWVVLLVTATLAVGLVSVVLAVTLVGILVIPFVVLAYIILVIASLVLPLGMVVFGMIAAWESYMGHWYRVPYLGVWLEKQMRGGFLTHI